jgi:hypothetical protein
MFNGASRRTQNHPGNLAISEAAGVVKRLILSLASLRCQQRPQAGNDRQPSPAGQAYRP